MLKEFWFIHGDRIVKRLKSFLWRAGCVAAIAGASWASENLGLLELPVWLQGLVGLGLAEITKWLNDNTDLFGGRNR